MSKLFEPLDISGIKIKNRFVRSATMDNLGRNMLVTAAQLIFYREMTRGEVGLIISSGLFPSLDGWTAPGQLGIHRDDMIPSLKKLTDIVHENGGKVAAQLMHAGWFVDPKTCGYQPVGPSAMVNPVNGLEARELATEEVYEHVDDFVQAGRRAFEAGFDAVQIHGAHSWLVSSFLSPVTNLRQDEWGGSPEKRAKFVVLIIEGIRRLIGPSFPIMIKLGMKDYHPSGKSIEEGIASLQNFIRAGLDAVEVSEGVEEEAFHHIRKDALHPYYIEECRKVKSVVDIPVIAVGGMRKLKEISEVVDGDIADAVSMCRPFIMDQHIVQKFHRGLARSSACNSCNGCIELMHNQGIHCIFNEKLINF